MYSTWLVRTRWQRTGSRGYKVSGYRSKQQVSSGNSMRPRYPDFHHPTLYILPQLTPHGPSAPPDRKRCRRIYPGASNFNLLLFTGEYHRRFPGGAAAGASGRADGYCSKYIIGNVFILVWVEVRHVTLVSSRQGYCTSGFLSHSASRKNCVLPRHEDELRVSLVK